MNVSDYIHDMAVKARAAAGELAKLTTAEKNAALNAIAGQLEKDAEAIKAANAIDVANAKAAGLKDAMIDRLTLTDARFKSMVEGVRHIVSLPDPVGEEIWTRERPSGITIRKVRVPFGVVAVVFESRPNVFIDTAALCLKTGNAIILRGGKEAIETNKALANSVRRGLEGLGSLEGLADAIQLVEILEHEAVSELVRSVGLIDVAIPRGGERLIRAMCEAALIPVLKHYKGVCHIYVDDEADLGMALAILDNAKVQRPGVCNAAEFLLIHKKIAPLFRPIVEAWAKDKGVTLHENEAGTEYLSLDINVAVVDDYRAAIDFINEHSSHHSECIVTNNLGRAKEFLRDVDSACVYHNVSTRFTDGGEFGMGAEIGISTDKLHARGPMGLEELTTYKYTVTGDGVIRQ
ncbi:MAG: glutamate-5-semialdehyde dehydrogenase [Kiritimatiellae bacterium]|nr:glutamate-5-semialdehyde dehydrogenase [Kiritimatiellia bacterium]